MPVHLHQVYPTDARIRTHIFHGLNMSQVLMISINIRGLGNDNTVTQVRREFVFDRHGDTHVLDTALQKLKLCVSRWYLLLYPEHGGRAFAVLQSCVFVKITQFPPFQT